MLPLIKNPKAEVYDVTHPWYDDDTGALGTFARVKSYFNLLKKLGPVRVYYPEPSKSVLIVYTDNFEARKRFALSH